MARNPRWTPEWISCCVDSGCVRGVLQAMMSVSLSQFRHSGMLRAVHDWLTSHYAHVPHTAAASILAALHTFGAASDRLCERVSVSLLPNLHSFSSGDRGRLAQVVWVLGTRADTAPFDALLNSAARRVVQHGGASAGALSPLELSQLASGLRPALSAIRSSLVPSLADDAAARLSGFTAQQVRLPSRERRVNPSELNAIANATRRCPSSHVCACDSLAAQCPSTSAIHASVSLRSHQRVAAFPIHTAIHTSVSLCSLHP